MRWRLTLLVAATTSAVVLAFLVPLALIVRSLAEERSLAEASSQAQTLAVIAAVQGAPGVKAWLDDPAKRPTGKVTVWLPENQTLGDQVSVPPTPEAKAGVASAQKIDGQGVIYSAAAGDDADRRVVRIVLSGAELHDGVGRRTFILALLGLLMLGLSVVAADALARRVSHPIRDLAGAADSLHEGRLETRTEERGPPEVVAMARALNRLAARIEQLLIAERESVADLSHRLRTPVTALRLDTESIDDPVIAERLELHVDNLERTVDAVLRDARRPVRPNMAARCDAATVIGERVAFWSALADEQGRSLRTRLPAITTWAQIDAVDLTDVVDALIDNVFAHTEEGVPLEVSVTLDPAEGVVLVVEDGGPGLPGSDVVNRGHSNAGSSGLGLDIVRRAAIASGGRLELGRSRLGGAQVKVVLGSSELRRSEPTLRRRRQRGAKQPGGLRSLFLRLGFR
ncbi:ATP-binding protein [Spongisporangium articulatum]|uniref:Signal transduction histidine-protein kinase/phosphatase MprB n=1 Tax=Spongisporangium articulatum TaxID=3362603 RepID=A0ABW8AHH8_9ACTN